MSIAQLTNVVQGLANSIRQLERIEVRGYIGAGTHTELTISGGIITITAITSYHSVDTESDAASDDLDTISGGIEGMLLFICAEDDARTVVVKHGTGNILLSGAADFSLDSSSDICWLFYNGSNWVGQGISIA